MKKRKPNRRKPPASLPRARVRSTARARAKQPAFGSLGRAIALEYRRGNVAYRHDFIRPVDIRYVGGEIRIRARLTRDGFIGD